MEYAKMMTINKLKKKKKKKALSDFINTVYII